MTKTDLIQKAAEKAGISEQEATKTLDALLTIIPTALKAGEDVKLLGFGSLILQLQFIATSCFKMIFF